MKNCHRNWRTRSGCGKTIAALRDLPCAGQRGAPRIPAGGRGRRRQDSGLPPVPAQFALRLAEDPTRPPKAPQRTLIPERFRKPWEFQVSREEAIAQMGLDGASRLARAPDPVPASARCGTRHRPLARAVGRKVAARATVGRTASALRVPASRGAPMGGVGAGSRGLGSRARHAGVGDFLAAQGSVRNRGVP